MLVYLNSDKIITKIKHQNALDNGKKLLGKYVTADVEKYIDSKIPQNTVHTAGWMQNKSDWNNDSALYDMSKSFHEAYPNNNSVAEEECGKLFGLIIFERFLLDENEWYFVKTEDFGMRYFRKGDSNSK